MKEHVLDQNLSVLDFAIPQELRPRLDDASRLPQAHPYKFFEPPMVAMNFGASAIQAWEPRTRYTPAAPAEAKNETLVSSAR